MLARRGFLHVENIFSPTTQASGFAASPEFTPDVSSLAFLSGVGGNRAGYWDRLLIVKPKPVRLDTGMNHIPIQIYLKIA